MRTDIVAAHGQLNSFGIDFAAKAALPSQQLFVAIPYLLLVAAAVGLQYLQMARLNARNPQAAQANPQAAMLQKYMPLIFGFIYLNVAAILNVYFIVSSAIRILTQEILFRKGIVAGPPGPGGRRQAAAPRRALSPTGPSGRCPSRRRPERRRLATAGRRAVPTERGPTGRAVPGRAAKASPAKSGSTAKATDPSNKSSGPVKPTGSTNGSNGKKGAGSGSGATTRRTARVPETRRTDLRALTRMAGVRRQPKEHPRSKAKRERKAR